MDRRLLFEEIIRRHEKSIRRAIRTKFPNAMEADDLFQELAIHIMQKLDDADDDDLAVWEADAWIMKVTANFCYSEFRKRGTKKGKAIKDLPDDGALERGAFHNGWGNDQDSDPSRSAMGVDLDQILLELNDRDRRIIVLKIFEGKSVQEIDQIMGITNSAQYYKRAIEGIRRRLNVDLYKELFDDFFPLD
jgi:RNA polymerase sigma factor (sigma-70 family)